VDYKKRFEKLQEQFNLGQKIANIGIWSLDYETDRLEWTEGVHQIFRTDPQTFKPTFEAFLQFVHPEDREKLKKAYSNSIKEKRDYLVEHRVVLADGEIKFVQERCQNFFNDNGNIIRSIGTVLDISIQKGLENEILRINRELEKKVAKRTSEQNILLSLFDKGDSILFKWKNDATWSIVHVSDSINDILGYDKEDFLTDNITYAECIYKDDLEQVMKELSTAMEKRKEYFEHKPYRVYTKDGDIKWVHDRTVIVRDNDGNIINFVGYITDITGIKEKDKQLLQQSRLAQMGEMISMIAHQWRQPLGAIAATSLDLQFKFELQEYDLSNKIEQDKCFSYIKKSLENIDGFVQNLTTTIDDFRNFYRPNKTSTTALINAPVKKALNIVKATYIANSIEIVEKYGCKNRVLMYENELMQVILNILKNAQDNFKEKSIKNPQVVIKTFDINDGIRLEISDNGGGICEDMMQKVFDPYFSTKSEKNGTGLGLYMSKTIIEAHHEGKLWAENRDNGVCFCIDLFRIQDTRQS